ncbi:MAG: hypothetical protein SPK50_05780 [Mobiluncus porci]|uniref:Uncharacterized protein n=1 Tax=Mobiluncus porci TaxID=2652278 RepID=A0A7K0K4L8_9ACTO|nr:MULTISPECIES: hypothetical protein [Mobiluncus]MCI6584356.1 hypothetical protein [Mobiluncus sp.]MDD7541774.1 hypothetical protein [Mobiluncus porci]MDY5748622.1 hypothetical protein [Mobiluncus porci]MST50368.1 hypothetical protein [Mobiluncus porci]
MMFNELEKTTTLILSSYVHKHKNSTYLFVFSEGDKYEGKWVTDYESDNEGVDGTEFQGPGYIEFNAMGFDVTKVINPGRWNVNNYLEIGYWNFPTRIVDLTENVTVYDGNVSEEARGD